MVEYIDIVDEYNRVLESKDRDSVHDERLLHRAVHVFLFNSKGKLFVQKRSKDKKEHPGKYDSSAAGHLDAGEGYDSAARRELKEELSIDAPVKRVMQIKACKETDNEFVQFYTAFSDRKIIIDKEEIEDGHFWDLEEIKRKVNSDKNAFTPTFRILFNNYLKLIRIMDILI